MLMSPSRPAPVIIVDYDPLWPRRFDQLAAVYGRVLEELHHRIEHVGSTSVPGLAAKPVIDIIIVIPSMADFALLNAALESLGYLHNGDQDVPGREVFKLKLRELMANDLGEEPWTHHLYVCPSGSKSLAQMLFFRDYLRTHADTSRRYDELKRGLAQKLRNDRVGYTDAKTAFVTAITDLMLEG
jgi:GrpB-like predicted nucleotidyltransferase (UPF0157 family)